LRSPQSSPCDSHSGLRCSAVASCTPRDLSATVSLPGQRVAAAPAEVYQLLLQKGDVEGTNGVAFGSRDRKQPEGTSGGYDRRRGAGEAAAILIDCSGVVIVSTESCDRIR
jgi:hypothetical protein